MKMTYEMNYLKTSMADVYIIIYLNCNRKAMKTKYISNFFLYVSK